MATGNKFNSFSETMPEKQHNLGSDTLKVMLTNSAPSSSNTQKSDITEISSGHGYSAGGATLSVSSSSQSSGLYKLMASNVTITASGGSIGPFRYAVLYNSNNNLLIGWWDYGSSITLASGEAFALLIDGTNGILQVQ